MNRRAPLSGTPFVIMIAAAIFASGCGLVPFPAKAKPTATAAQTKDYVPKTAPEAPPPTQPAPVAEARKPTPIYVDASKGQEGTLGAIRVSVSSAKVSSVPLNVLGEQTQSEQPHLTIGLRLRNVSDTRKVNYSSYNSAFLSNLALKDNFGNSFQRVMFGFGTDVVGQAQSQAIYPGKWVDDVLVFEKPIDKAEFLLLTLSGENVESKDESVIFVLPRIMWSR
jgi:hypothetical protein